MRVDFSMGGYTTSRLSLARQQQSESLQSIASGEKKFLSREDSGAYSVSLKLSNLKKYEKGFHNGLQNAVSISHTQQAALERMRDILYRISELAGLAVASKPESPEREQYQAQYEALVGDFNKYADSEMNGVKLFGSIQSEEEIAFTNALTDHWLKASEDLIVSQYGWGPKLDDTWDLIVDENGPQGGTPSYVNFTTDADHKADVENMIFDMPDLPGPYTQPESLIDGVVAHEMVHLLQAQNTYAGNLTGESNPPVDEQTATWFSEGIAEFIKGDDWGSVVDLWRLAGSPNPISLDQLKDQVPTLLSSIGDGDGTMTYSEEYSASYLAVRFLHQKIVDVGQSDGLKHMTRWMADKFKNDMGHEASGINAYLREVFPPSSPYSITDNDDFLDKFKGVDGQIFVKDLISSWDLLNNDTGSISGSDIQDGADSLDAFDVIPDAFGPPTASFIKEENDDFDPINVGGGVTFQLNTISSLTFGDSAVFNLTNANGVELVLGRVDELIQITSENMALVGSNINQMENFSNILSIRQTGFASNLNNINGVSYSEEMEALSYSKILINSNLSMRAQAMDIQRSATLSLLAA